ncbi:MAG: hypothetical protein ACKV0T_16100 [Planctomycetales bacterium]
MNWRIVGWTVLFVIAGLWLAYRAAFSPGGMGRAYVKAERIAPKSETDTRIRFTEAEPKHPDAVLSVPRTIGLWAAALCTLAILSFLYRDNPLYKLAESVFVGVTAAWAMVVGFYDGIVDKLLANLAPALVRGWALPDLERTKEPNLLYLIPLMLGIMLLWRLLPRGGWIARWPLAFVVGTFAGLKLVNFLDADFVSQIRSTIIPLIVMVNGRFDPWGSIRNIGLIIGVLSCLTYFFFSVEHKGLVGAVSRVGIWFLMVTFGASFAFTVMGRIALLAARVEFLLDDWLWLIDPTGKRPPGW